MQQHMDTDMPQEWNIKYDNYYNEISNVILVYFYGISAECSNKEICQQYLNGGK